MTVSHINMSQADIEAFLQTPRLAVMGTNRLDGPPQQTPVWYFYQDGKMYISMSVHSAKYKNLRRDPRLNVCVAGHHPDARAVILSGTIEFLAQDHPNAHSILWQIVRRYYNSDADAQAYLDSTNDAAESIIAVLAPTRTIAQDYN